MFALIGERINTTRERMRRAVESREADFIAEEARKQAAAGATHIDINAGARPDSELEDMTWLVQVVQQAAALPLCLDSANPAVLEAACDAVDRPPVINSISLEASRHAPLLSFLKGRDCSVVALCMSDDGMPATARQTVDLAGRLIRDLEQIGMGRRKIYIDPLVQPVAVDHTRALTAMAAVREIMSAYPGVHTVCGLSNVSFGLPRRRAVNRSFLPLMMSAGLDSAILDPLDTLLMQSVRAADMLLGHDPYCMNFLKAAAAAPKA